MTFETFLQLIFAVLAYLAVLAFGIAVVMARRRNRASVGEEPAGARRGARFYGLFTRKDP